MEWALSDFELSRDEFMFLKKVEDIFDGDLAIYGKVELTLTGFEG